MKLTRPAITITQEQYNEIAATMKQLKTLVANENAEAASKHLKPLSFT